MPFIAGPAAELAFQRDGEYAPSRNRTKSSHPYRGVRIKDGQEELRWRYPESTAMGEVYVLDGAPFNGDLGRAVPLRSGAKYPQRTHHEGHYVVGKTGQQVWFESMAEYVALMQIEQSFSLGSISSQPCCFLFRGEIAHYPDYAVKTARGATVIVDVRSAHLMRPRDVAKFQGTARVCEQLGWGYSVVEPLQGYEQHNLVWLAGYRHWFTAPDSELQAKIVRAASSHIRLIDLARLLDPDLEWHYLPAVYHLMFTKVLEYDQTSPLSDDTPVWRI